MQNIEFKCELRDPALARAVCRGMGAAPVDLLEQVDTYFKLADGRLKRRESAGHPAEYIFYHRDNLSRPRISRFSIYTAAEALERFGTVPLPTWVVVRKRREVYLINNVRVHLDDVEGLGSFLELEALVSPRMNVARCHRAIAELRRALAPALGEPISASYSDLVAAEMEGESAKRS